MQSSFAQTTAAKPGDDRHEFVIANFKTESGVTLPQARVVYRTVYVPTFSID
jgi:hypothetical protein